MAGRKVIDASALGAIAFGESGASRVLELIGDADLFAPSLLPYEMASIARKKMAAEPSRAREIRMGLDLALRMDVRLVDPDQVATLEIALDSGITTYDAAYLWLSRSMCAQIVTLDAALARAARSSK